MLWTSAAGLLGLLPWAAVVAYLSVRAGRATSVPHLAFWRGEPGAVRKPIVRRRPSAAVICALLAVLSGVIASGGPGWLDRDRATAVVVVLDRGVTMASPAGGRPFRGSVDRARSRLGDVPARLVCVPSAPGAPAVPSVGWGEQAERVVPTAVDTGATLPATIAELLRQPELRQVIVLSDQPVSDRDGRVLQVRPSEPRSGVGIVSVAARARPRPQVMVRLLNRSARTSATVRVSSASTETVRTVDLPAAGRSADTFIDVPQLGSVVAVVVDPDEVDGRAWLTQTGDAIEVVATPGVPSALRRMVDVFNRSSFGGGGGGPGRTVVATDRPPAAGQAEVAVIDDPRRGHRDDAANRVLAHPVTSGVDQWVGTGSAPPNGFAVVVTGDGGAVVAVRDGPPRQVWADLDVARMSRSADWVVFLADAFRWVGGDGRRYASSAPHRLGSDWNPVADGPVPGPDEPGLWPGLYRSSDGRTVAVNAATGAAGHTTASPNTGSGSGPSRTSPAVRSLDGPVAAAALACMGLAAALWPAATRRSKPVPKLT